MKTISQETDLQKLHSALQRAENEITFAIMGKRPDAKRADEAMLSAEKIRARISELEAAAPRVNNKFKVGDKVRTCEPVQLRPLDGKVTVSENGTVVGLPAYPGDKYAVGFSGRKYAAYFTENELESR